MTDNQGDAVGGADWSWRTADCPVSLGLASLGLAGICNPGAQPQLIWPADESVSAARPGAHRR